MQRRWEKAREDAPNTIFFPFGVVGMTTGIPELKVIYMGQGAPQQRSAAAICTGTCVAQRARQRRLQPPLDTYGTERASPEVATAKCTGIHVGQSGCHLIHVG